MGDLKSLTNEHGYDVIILADLIFNHSQHAAILRSCADLMAADAVLYVVFTHHRPHKAVQDMQFFDVAKTHGFNVEFMMTQLHQPMFEQDPGDPVVRSQVHFYKLSKEIN